MNWLLMLISFYYHREPLRVQSTTSTIAFNLCLLKILRHSCPLSMAKNETMRRTIQNQVATSCFQTWTGKKKRISVDVKQICRFTLWHLNFKIRGIRNHCLIFQSKWACDLSVQGNRCVYDHVWLLTHMQGLN